MKVKAVSLAFDARLEAFEAQVFAEPE